MMQLERQRQEFEQRMEKDRRDFELKLEELNKQERRRTDRIMIGLTIAAVIFAITEVAAAVLGITNDSWIIRILSSISCR